MVCFIERRKAKIIGNKCTVVKDKKNNKTKH